MAFIAYASFQQIPIEINGLYTCECFSGGLWVQPPPKKSTTVVYEKYNQIIQWNSNLLPPPNLSSANLCIRLI